MRTWLVGNAVLLATTVAPIKTLPLPMLASIPHVRVEVGHTNLVVVEDVDLPRGDWRAGDLDLCVAFGAPGAPLAFDARLFPVPDGALEPRDADAGVRIGVDRSAHCPEMAHELLGPPQMAGVVVHLPEGTFWKAIAPGRMAMLRLRAVLPVPEEDARSGHEIVLRLGAARGTPMALGTLEITSTADGPSVTAAAARLCGPEADPWPLAIALVPRPIPGPAPSWPAPIAPVLAVRHASDDLCVRFWTNP